MPVNKGCQRNLVQHTTAGIMSQSSHHSDWRVIRRAVNRSTIAMTASVKVAMLTPSIRGTWESVRSKPGGGGASASASAMISVQFGGRSRITSGHA